MPQIDIASNQSQAFLDKYLQTKEKLTLESQYLRAVQNWLRLRSDVTLLEQEMQFLSYLMQFYPKVAQYLQSDSAVAAGLYAGVFYQESEQETRFAAQEWLEKLPSSPLTDIIFSDEKKNAESLNVMIARAKLSQLSDTIANAKDPQAAAQAAWLHITHSAELTRLALGPSKNWLGFETMTALQKQLSAAQLMAIVTDANISISVRQAIRNRVVNCSWWEKTLNNWGFAVGVSGKFTQQERNVLATLSIKHKAGIFVEEETDADVIISTPQHAPIVVPSASVEQTPAPQVDPVVEKEPSEFSADLPDNSVVGGKLPTQFSGDLPAGSDAGGYAENNDNVGLSDESTAATDAYWQEWKQVMAQQINERIALKFSATDDLPVFKYEATEEEGAKITINGITVKQLQASLSHLETEKSEQRFVASEHGMTASVSSEIAREASQKVMSSHGMTASTASKKEQYNTANASVVNPGSQVFTSQSLTALISESFAAAEGVTDENAGPAVATGKSPRRSSDNGQSRPPYVKQPDNPVPILQQKQHLDVKFR